MVDIFQWQLAAVYFFGGLAKLSDDWYSGTTWLAMGATDEHGGEWGTIPLTRRALAAIGTPAEFSAEPVIAKLLSVAGAWFHLLVGPCLLQTRLAVLRWLAILAAVAFHGLNAIGLQVLTVLVWHSPCHYAHYQPTL